MKGNPNPKHKFKKGVVTNPKGRPPLPPDVKEAAKLNREEFERSFNKVIKLKVKELHDLIKHPDTDAITAVMATVMAFAIKHGDHRRFDFILNRLIGKVPERFEGPNGEPVSFVGLMMLAEKRKKELDEEGEE